MKIEDFNFAGHKAIVRVDFNVPLDENGNVTDDTRIRGALPTLKKVLADGGALIMMSHMGKPKGKVKPELSLSQIVKNVSDALGVEVKFAKDCGNADAEAAALKPGEALLLENLRFYPEEEGRFAHLTTSLTVGRVWTQVLRLARLSLQLSRVLRLSSGTVLLVYSSSTTSLVVLRQLLTQSLRLLRRVHSLSSVVVTL